MESHPIESLMKSTLENLKDMIDINTVVGDPIKSADGTTIIPISRVSLGFVSGGSEFYSIKTKEDHENYPFGGGSGSGVSVKPVAFLIIKDDLIRLLPVDQNNINIFDRVLDQIPQFIDMFKKTTKADKECKDTEEEE
ncbi:GerW family sporulation protein [Clostridium sp.]|jgi:sporulation protein YtfJ|uniref:GerW family sporulation protein n=1 Tax=Clostridium sp. TaxID=1506 RepID=UPI0039F4C2DC